MGIRVFKYASPFLIYWGALYAFVTTGLPVWLPLIYSWIIIPLLELFIRPDDSNLSAAEEELAKKNKAYDCFLYAVVLLQYFALGLFLYSVTYHSSQQSWVDITGKVLVMGLLCGTFGINVGHELGHRTNRMEQFLAKAIGPWRP